MKIIRPVGVVVVAMLLLLVVGYSDEQSESTQDRDRNVTPQ